MKLTIEVSEIELVEAGKNIEQFDSLVETAKQYQGFVETQVTETFFPKSTRIMVVVFVNRFPYQLTNIFKFLQEGDMNG